MARKREEYPLLSLIIPSLTLLALPKLLTPALLANDPWQNCCRQAVKVETHLIFQTGERSNVTAAHLHWHGDREKR